MARIIFQSLSKAFYKDRFLFLIILILVMELFGSFMVNFFAIRLFMDICFSVIFILSIYTISQKKRHILFGVILVTPALFAVWSRYFEVSQAMITIGNIFGVCFFAFMALNILKYVFAAQEVTRETISGAIVVYLLMGLMWGFIYTVLEKLYPGSFAIAHDVDQDLRSHLIYYSYVTITTLGYGDITPVGLQAQSLSIVEAITGQIYLVVLVAWLVGMYVSRKSKPL